MPKGKITKDWDKLEVTIFGKVYPYNTLPKEMKPLCGFHGYCQKLGDVTASMKNYSQAEKSAAIDKVDGNLRERLWRTKAVGMTPEEKARQQALRDGVEKAKTTASPAELKILAKFFGKALE